MKIIIVIMRTISSDDNCLQTYAHLFKCIQGVSLSRSSTWLQPQWVLHHLVGDTQVLLELKKRVRRLSFTCSEAPCLISRSWNPTRLGSRADFFNPKRVSSVGSCWSAGSSRVARSMRGRTGMAGVGTIRLEEGTGASTLSETSHISNRKASNGWLTEI